MNVTILLFFALPIATIILSIVLQKILKCPGLVAATFFSIYLVLTYAIDSSLLIFTIAYTIVAYITAILVRIFCNIRENRCENNLREGNLKIHCGGNCICNEGEGNPINNNTSRNCRVNSCNSNDLQQARFTLTTNQMNPVVCLTSKNNSEMGRNSCCCGRR